MTNNSSAAIYAKLKTMGIELPPVSTPAAAYMPYVQTGNLIFLSGHLAKKDGKPWLGQFGKNMNTDQGKQAARAVAIDLLGTLHAALAVTRALRSSPWRPKLPVAHCKPMPP